MPGDGAETDRAVAAEHERELAGRERFAHAVGRLGRAGHDGIEVLGVGPLAIGLPAPVAASP